MSIKQPPPVKDHRNGIEVRGKKHLRGMAWREPVSSQQDQIH